MPRLSLLDYPPLTYPALLRIFVAGESGVINTEAISTKLAASTLRNRSAYR